MPIACMTRLLVVRRPSLGVPTQLLMFTLPITYRGKLKSQNFKAISKAFFVNFDKAITYANKKDVKFFDIVDEQVWDNLSNIFTLFNSKAYEDMRNFSEDYEVSINGTDVIKKDKSKKIA